MREGLPQGATSSPMLWLCYANDLAPMLRRHNVSIGLYADDLVIFASDHNVDSATLRVQAALDELHEWADTWNMEVSDSKTKSILFSTHRDEVNAKRALSLCLGNQILEQVKEITILGVKFDPQLTFRPHIDTTKLRMDRRIGALKALAGTRWGCREHTLRKLYKTFVEPVALYGCSAYMQFARPANRDIMDRSARAAARVISGCPVDTRKEVLLTEAQIVDITAAAEERGAIQREKLLRLDPRIPAYQTAARTTKRRLKNRDTWRERATEVAREAGLEETPREQQRPTRNPPWESAG